MDRVGTPADVAGLTAFLANDDATFISGESILVGVDLDAGTDS